MSYKRAHIGIRERRPCPSQDNSGTVHLPVVVVPNFLLIFHINFGYWHLCLISMSSSRCKSFSDSPQNLVSDLISQISICSCTTAVFLHLWRCFIVIDRLWPGSEQAADEWGVRLVSGASSAPRDAVSSRSRSVHRSETSQHFSLTLMRSHWKSLNNPAFT